MIFVTTLLMAFLGQQVASAEELSLPIFFDAREQLTKPDLSDLKRMRFLTTTDFPPFNYMDSEGRLSGLHIDLARAICTELDISEICEIQALPFGELGAALARGEGEAIIAGLAVTEETRAKYAFSRSYLRFPARFIMRKAASASKPVLPALDGKRVGVVAASAHERFLRKDFDGLSVVTFPIQEAMLADLNAARIDAAFGDGMRLSLWLGRAQEASCCRFVGGPYMAPDFLGSGLAIATMPQNKAYAVAFDAALQQISTKGIFAELYLRYFPISFY